MTSLICNCLKNAQETLADFSANQENIQAIGDATEIMVNSLKQGGRILSCGNGGSMCDALHFAEELTGRYRLDRPPVSAIALSDPAHISCTANDFGYEYIFSRLVEAWGRPHDVLLVLSTSGNSANILKAVAVALKKQIRVVGLLGKGGGKLKDKVDIPIVVPSLAAERIQEIHIKIIHILVEGIEQKIFPAN